MAAALATGSGGTVDDMDSVHRFTDPAYADLTLRLRAGQEPERLFDRLRALGLVRLHSSVEDAREDIAATAISAMGKCSVAVTVATNDEARALNELIRAQRVARAEVDETTTVAGSDGLPIGRGDVITTRKNDNALGVANRQAWTVQGVGSDGTVWAVENSSPPKHRRSVALPSSYVGEHVHLGYAATAYGVQGVTTTTSHTQLSEALDASGVYVGMTRGRDSNVLHIVAEDLDEAREQFIGALQLDRADRGLQMATADAQAAVAGLTAEGPVKLVNDERARLVAVIAQAEREAAKWERTAGLLSAQVETHAREEDEALDTLTVAEAHLTSVQSEAMESLRPHAVADGQAYIDAHEHRAAAWKELNSVGRLGRRAANRRLEAVNAEAHEAQERTLARWGSLPSPSKWDANTRDGLDAWAKRVADERAESQPVTSRALQEVKAAGEELRQVRWRHQRESEGLRLQAYGRRDAASHRATAGTRSAASRAERWRLRVDAARADLAQIESLPVGRALEFIEARRERIWKVESARAETCHAEGASCWSTASAKPTVPNSGLGI